MDMVRPLKVLVRLQDQVGLEALTGRRKWKTDHSGVTGQDSGIVNKRGTETGNETGIERGTGGLEVESVSAMEGEEVVVTKWMGETGPGVGRKM